ncbi:MAG: hypothetical protein J7J94_02700, partial [Thaumarchaeota archaeon]|nr:hypothetical protein [Nitrososphaerota archaeon]
IMLLDLNSMILLYAAIGGGYLAWMILKPKPNAVVLEKIGENFYLSKAFHNENYLQHRRATYPIPSTYNYWVLLGRGFIRFRLRWVRFFYIHDSVLSKIEEERKGENEEVIEAKPAINQQLMSRFISSQTLEKLLRGLTIPKTTLLFNFLAGTGVGVMLGVMLARWLVI